MNSIIRMIAFSSVLVHLWAGCGNCYAMASDLSGEGSVRHRDTAWADRETASPSPCRCHHTCEPSSPVSHPDDTPCEAPDDGCDHCECVFIVPTPFGETDSFASEISQLLTLLSVSQPVQPELSSRPTLDLACLEKSLSDSRSLRARIAVLLL